MVLYYYHSIGQTHISNSYFLQVLARKHCAEIVAFSSLRKAPTANRAYSVLDGIYKSFNVSRFLHAFLTPEQKQRAEKLFQEIRQSLRTKNDVFTLQVLGIPIGIDIYESYLYKYSRPTVVFDDALFDTVREGIETTVYWSDFLDQNKVSAVVVSHDVGIQEDVLCRVAYHRHVPVYLADCIRLRLADRPHTYSAHFPRYHEMFQRFSLEEKEKAILLAKKQMERRMNGEVGVDMDYSTASAFRRSDAKEKVLQQSNRTKVLIATHCFFDNPHGYGGMMFLDFYEWLCFLGKISEKTEYEWYVKTHPDMLPGTQEILDEILAQYPRLRQIPGDTSAHQLVEEGIHFVLTIYGTVGYEYPILGIPVINAGFNPTVAYHFNWHPKNLQEYEDMLLHLNTLKKEIDIHEIYEFYYMYNYYSFVDDMMLPSHRKFVTDLGLQGSCSSEAYSYFLDRLTETKHQEILNAMARFVDSGLTNYFEMRPRLDFGQNH